MKYLIILIFCLLNNSILFSQNEPWISTDDYYTWSSSASFSKVPYGYTAIARVTLNKALQAGKTYEVTILVEATLPKSQSGVYKAHNYEFYLFDPSSKGDFLKNNETVSSDAFFSIIELSEFNYSKRSFFTFKVKPKENASHLTVAIRDDTYVRHVDRSAKLKDIVVLEIIEDKEVAVNSIVDNKITSRKRKPISGKITVNQETVSIEVYDHRRIDNDIVTLSLNNEIIIEKLLLKRKKKKIKVKLKPGKNTILLYAENLGEVPPNTATIEIITKNQKVKKVLASDLKQSEYLTIYYEVDDE